MSDLRYSKRLARKPATEGLLRQMASELAMVSAKESMDRKQHGMDYLQRKGTEV